jgi:DNA repair protein RecN (Recombination protein N)
VLGLLRIRELVLVQELALELGPGLNVITGETGAGKSVLVHALQLVLGARARADVVRTGADQAEVEALFEVRGAQDAVRERLRALGHAGDELVVRRVVGASGRARAFVDGRLTTATELAEIARGLVDISSQHEHHALADPAGHLRWLDAYADLEGDVEAMSAAWRDLTVALAARDEVRARLGDRAAREELIRFQRDEIRRVAPLVGEDEALVAEITRLRASERLVRAAAGAEDALSTGEASALEAVDRVIAELEEAARLDADLAAPLQRLEAARGEIDGVARGLGRYARTVESDPGRLAEAEERLADLRRLLRRHAVSLDALLGLVGRLDAELGELDDADGRLAAAEGAVEGARSRAAALARRLTARRNEGANRLSAAITAELATLGMGGARVEVSVAPLVGAVDRDVIVDGARLGERGIDRVEFLIAPNRGEEPRPLRRVASGGELSRALLALKRVLAGLGPVGTYVFDEVDTGVGGAVADTIGRKIAEVARHHQVVCITHLPQIACYADHHFRVSKSEVDGRTLSRVEALDGAEQVEEIARMLGGASVGDVQRRAAEALLRAARPR